MQFLTIFSMSTSVLEVTCPAIVIELFAANVSTATLEFSSPCKYASSILSEM